MEQVDNQSLLLLLMIIQLMGINFYFDNIHRAKTTFQKIKIGFLSAYPTLIAISILIRPLEA